MTRFRRRALIALLALMPLLGAWLSVQPRTDRAWASDMAVMPSARFDGDSVHVSGIRNAAYRSTEDFTVSHYDRSFDLGELETVWYLVEPFGDMKGPAHTLVSFGFSDGSYLAISVELRREPGEKFSPVKGLLKQYELMYVVADERDVIRLRTSHRHDDVYLYPVRADADQRRRLFISMLERANALREHPEFYNTLTNTCTTNIVRHVNEIAPQKVPFSYKVLLPGYSDRLAYDLGLIDTDLPFDAAKARYHINARALRHADDPAFSELIRRPE
ncbi:MAG TPA: DUF4105 domain-containing protein [Gemmatimonadales bacterium]|nr:DUF4105 domain-containing protein [Gemmatimonadales bacterium]